MHVFRSMNRHEMTVTISLAVLVSLLLGCGAWLIFSYGGIDSLVLSSSPGQAQDADEPESRQQLAPSAPPAEIQPTRDADILIISLANHLGITVKAVITIYCFAAVLLSIGLFVYWHKYIYLPVRYTCVFVCQIVQPTLDDEEYACATPPLAHPTYSSHHPRKKSHSR